MRDNRDSRIPNLNTSIRAQQKHEPTMREVRVNGQITETEVKQLLTWKIIGWVVIFSRFYLLATTGFLSKRQITKRSKWFASIYFKPKQQRSIGSQQLEK